MSKGDRFLTRYAITRELGSGSFGVVYLAEDKETGQKVAIKRIVKMGKFASREIDILQRLSGAQNCIHMLDCFYTSSAKNAMIQNMVFEFFPDNLENFILRFKEKKAHIPPDEIKHLAFQMLNGLAEIHGIGAIHRDLKPENLLLNARRLAVSDFGSSKIKKPHMKSTPYIVSRFYRAPELLLCVTEYDEKIDVWAAGCIIAEMCNREPVFQGKDDGEQLAAIIRGLGPIPQTVSKKFIERGAPFDRVLVKKFAKEAPKRSIEKWVSRFLDKKLALDLLGRLLDFDPETRLSAREALEHPFFAGTEGRGRGRRGGR